MLPSEAVDCQNRIANAKRVDRWPTRIAFDLPNGLDRAARKVAKLLNYLPSVLERDDVVTLFETIRYESGRLEGEWQPRFERAFAKHADALPGPLYGGPAGEA